MLDEIKNKLKESGISLEELIKVEKPELIPLLDVLEKINTNLETLASKESPQMEMPDTHKVEIAGAERITIQGKDGKDGVDGKDSTVPGPEGKQGKEGKAGKDGKDGKDGNDGLAGKDGRDGIHGKDGENGKDGSPDTGEQIVDKINEDESEKKIKREKVEGLNEELTAIRNLPRGGGINRGSLRAASFSFSGDGSTTSFYLPTEPSGKGWFIFAHYEGQWLQKDVHYTVAGKLFNTLGGTSTFTAQSGTVIEGFVIY